MTYTELIQSTTRNSLSEVNKKVYCIANKAFVDNALIKAYSVCCIFSRDVRDVSDDEEQKIKSTIKSLTDDEQEFILAHATGIIRHLDMYDIQLRDMSILIEVAAIPNENLFGDISDEVIRAFIIHSQVEEEFVKSDIDKQLFTYSKIFTISDINLIDYARANRVKWLDRLTDTIYAKGNIELLDEMKPIQNAVFDWR